MGGIAGDEMHQNLIALGEKLKSGGVTVLPTIEDISAKKQAADEGLAKRKAVLDDEMERQKRNEELRIQFAKVYRESLVMAMGDSL